MTAACSSSTRDVTSTSKSLLQIVPSTGMQATHALLLMRTAITGLTTTGAISLLHCSTSMPCLHACSDYNPSVPNAIGHRPGWCLEDVRDSHGLSRGGAVGSALPSASASTSLCSLTFALARPLSLLTGHGGMSRGAGVC